MIEQSLIVANAYVSDHAQIIRAEILAMAYDLGPRQAAVRPEPRTIPPIPDRAGQRARTVRRDHHQARRLDGRARRRHHGKPVVLPSPQLLSQITETEPQVALIPQGDHVAAAIKLRGYDNMYLYVAQMLDPRVVQQLTATQESIGEYANLEARRLGIQIAFALMFAVIALIVLLSSAWIGLDFANRLVAPIRRLIGAANVVSTGNLQYPGAGVPLGRRSRPSWRDLQQDDAGTAHAA